MSLANTNTQVHKSTNTRICLKQLPPLLNHPMFSYSILYKTFNLQDEDEEERDSFSNVERPQLPDRGSERSILALIDARATLQPPQLYYLDVTCCLIDTFNQPVVTHCNTNSI